MRAESSVVASVSSSRASFVPQLTFIQQPTWANMISTAWIKPHGVTHENYFNPFLNVFTWWAVNRVLITFQLTSSSTIDTELTASWHPLSDHCVELHYWYQPGATWGQYDNLIIMPALAIIYRPCLRLVIRTINSISARWVLLWKHYLEKWPSPWEAPASINHGSFVSRGGIYVKL